MTEADIDAAISALQTALSKGERSVQFADRSVIYKSTEEVLDALRYFEGLKGSAVERPRQFLGHSKKGF